MNDDVTASEATARAAILTLLVERGADKTICPSEAAREAAGIDWRAAMPATHAAAWALAEEGLVELRQRGVARDAGLVRGAYRIASAVP